MALGDKAEGCGGRGSPRGVSERRAQGGIECVVSTGTSKWFSETKKTKSELDRFNNIIKYPRHIVEWGKVA